MRALLILLLLSAPALAADNTPFYRKGDPNLLPATQTARQYQIQQPAGSNSYRLVNPCNVDIRITTVRNMSDPITTTTGTRFLARSVEVLASSPPLSVPRTVSIIALGDPGPNGCTVELSYGTGQ